MPPHPEHNQWHNTEQQRLCPNAMMEGTAFNDARRHAVLASFAFAPLSLPCRPLDCFLLPQESHSSFLKLSEPDIWLFPSATDTHFHPSTPQTPNPKKLLDYIPQESHLPTMSPFPVNTIQRSFDTSADVLGMDERLSRTFR